MKSGLRGRYGGFTIIEVMIVLAVTMAIFASAAFLINGRQNATLFSQSINSLQAQMQQIVNDISSGYYPNSGAISCAAGGSGGGVNLSAAASEQGTNKDCIFLGKVIQFGIDAPDSEQYNIYTIAGLRGSGASPSTDLASAKARLIARTAAEEGSGSPIPANEFDTKQLQYGLTVSQSYLASHAGSSYASIGFASKLSVSGSPDAGQQVDIVPIAGSALHDSPGVGVEKINAALRTATVNPPGGVQICFNSGSTDQSGLLSLSGAGRQAIIGLKIFSSQDCA